jgi:hypothetical protein
VLARQPQWHTSFSLSATPAPANPIAYAPFPAWQRAPMQYCKGCRGYPDAAYNATQGAKYIFPINFLYKRYVYQIWLILIFPLIYLVYVKLIQLILGN